MALIQEFRRTPNAPPGETSRKWAVGNALSVVADDSVFEEIVELVSNRQFARDREMLALALANMPSHREDAVDVLISLLNDAVVAGHAVSALGKIRAEKAGPHLERSTAHPKAWVRNEAKWALSKIQSRAGSKRAR